MAITATEFSLSSLIDQIVEEMYGEDRDKIIDAVVKGIPPKRMEEALTLAMRDLVGSRLSQQRVRILSGQKHDVRFAGTPKAYHDPLDVLVYVPGKPDVRLRDCTEADL